MLVVRNGRSDSLTLEGRVVAPAQGIDESLRITVTDGVISALEPGSASGLVVAPAFVDPHVHLRTPGREDEETLRSGTEAAASSRTWTSGRSRCSWSRRVRVSTAPV